MTGPALLVKPPGLRGHAYWLTSPDFEVILGKSEKFPPVLVQLHSAYMHSLGIDRALDLVEALLQHEVFAGAYRLNVSRIDIYADFQGWEPQVADLDRFVSFNRHRRGFQENQREAIKPVRFAASIRTCSEEAFASGVEEAPEN